MIARNKTEKKSPGRPLKYGEKLVPVTFEIPESKVEQAKEMIKKLKESQ